MASVPPATGPSSNKAVLLPILADYRSGIQRVHGDPSAIPRIDQIENDMQRDWQRFERKAYVIGAVTMRDEYTRDADRCIIAGIAKVGEFEALELTDARGAKLGRIEKLPYCGWGGGGPARGSPVQTFNVVLYTRPSQFPPSTAPADGQPLDEVPEAFRLPANMRATDLQVEVLFKDGRKTERIRVTTSDD